MHRHIQSRLRTAPSAALFVVMFACGAGAQTTRILRPAADSGGGDRASRRVYDIVWGSNPNLETAGITGVSAASAVIDAADAVLRGSVNAHWWGRTASVAVIDIGIAAQLYGTLPHEIGGHLTTARTFGVSPHLHSNFPSLGGDTPFSIGYADVSSTGRALIAAAGPEQTAVTARQVTQELYMGRAVPTYSGLFLLGGKYIDAIRYYEADVAPFIDDPARYFADNAKHLRDNPVPNDPVAYLLAITERHGDYAGIVPPGATWAYQPADPRVYITPYARDVASRIRRVYLEQLLDPAIAFGAIGLMRYVARGDEAMTVPMVPIGPLRIMPGTHATMGAYGPELYADLYVRGGAASLDPPSTAIAGGIDNVLVTAYVRTGGLSDQHVHGAGLEISNIRVGSAVAGTLQGDLWQAPTAQRGNVAGAFVWEMRRGVRWLGGAGYKGAGSLFGKPFRAGGYAYTGLRIVGRGASNAIDAVHAH